MVLPSRGDSQVAFRIEYFAKRERVMAVPCPKTLEEAVQDAAAGLNRYGADRAHVRDIDGRGKNDRIIERETSAPLRLQ